MVDAISVLAGGWASECEVPFEEIFVKGGGGVVRRGGSGEFGSFAEYAFYCGGFRVELASSCHSAI